MNMTITGDIRRIRRSILKPNGNGTVVADYGELHKVLDAIEVKEKHYKSLIKELADALKETCVPDSCKNCETEYKDCTSECPNRKRRALIAKAKEVLK